jgi:hypothetical protein
LSERGVTDQADADRTIQALNQRHAETVDRFNLLWRYCCALPWLTEVEMGRSDRMVMLDQMYLDRLAELVDRCKP